MTKNIFTYWDGPKPNIIQQLEEILKRACFVNSYNLHQLNINNLEDYISVGDNFYNLKYHVDQTDYIRVKLLRKFGGLWVDSDCLVFTNLDRIFTAIESRGSFLNGFFRGKFLMGFNNAIIGALSDSNFFKEWEECNEATLQSNINSNQRLPFGNGFLSKNKRKVIQNIYIINAISSKIDPISPRSKILLSDSAPVDLIFKNQPIIHLYGHTYREFESMEEGEKKKTLLCKLINKSLYVQQ